jgi:hypothetical protein
MQAGSQNLNAERGGSPGAPIASRTLSRGKKMAFVSHSDSASLNEPAAQAAAETRYRFWVRDSTGSSWRQLPGLHTMAEVARMLRQKRFVEFALIDGSAQPA